MIPAATRTRISRNPGSGKGLDKIERQLNGAEVVNRFADQPVSLYQTTTGETCCSPCKVTAAPAGRRRPRPRDILILIDTSASKAQGYLWHSPSRSPSNLLPKLNADDRVALWTVNTTANTIPLQRLPASRQTRRRSQGTQQGVSFRSRQPQARSRRCPHQLSPDRCSPAVDPLFG